jgi:hypothetical protein
MMTIEFPTNAEATMYRQTGTFSISARLIDSDPSAVRTALRDCIIVRAEMLWGADVISYVAIHPEFDAVDDGAIPPHYHCRLEKHEDGSVTRTWQREEEAGVAQR